MKPSPRQRPLIVFGSLASSVFGAAESVTYTNRFAWIKLPGPGNEKAVRVSRKRFKLAAKPHRWNAFRLAEIAGAVREGREVGQSLSRDAIESLTP